MFLIVHSFACKKNLAVQQIKNNNQYIWKSFQRKRLREDFRNRRCKLTDNLKNRNTVAHKNMQKVTHRSYQKSSGEYVYERVININVYDSLNEEKKQLTSIFPFSSYCDFE